MGLRNKFNQLFNRQTSPNQGADGSDADSKTGFESLASEQSTSFDDLASVPFAGDAAEEEIAPQSPPRESETKPSISAPEITKEGTKREFSPKSADFYQDFPDDPPLPDDFAEVRQATPEAQAFRNLFNTDLRVKSELIELAPDDADRIDESSQMAYAEKTYKALRGFRHDFASLAKDFGFGETPSLEDFFQREEQKFMIGRYTPDTPAKLYREVFTDMSADYVEKVKEASRGHVLLKDNDLTSLTRDASTINELLHAYHSYLTNNEDVLQSVPEITSKQSGFGDRIVWRGDKTAMAQQIFDAIPSDLGMSETDLIAVDDYIAMMVRDRAHALTLTTEPDPQDPQMISVHYNIPKICNIKMIDALPGISHRSDTGARGSFVVSRNKIGNAIADFISRVPTDDDMFREGGDSYGRFNIEV